MAGWRSQFKIVQFSKERYCSISVKDFFLIGILSCIIIFRSETRKWKFCHIKIKIAYIIHVLISDYPNIYWKQVLKPFFVLMRREFVFNQNNMFINKTTNRNTTTKFFTKLLFYSCFAQIEKILIPLYMNGNEIICMFTFVYSN